MQVSCPSCGGAVDFKSRSSVFQVCSYCSSMIVRTDMNLELIGKMASLPPDMSPFQIGTTGRYEKKHFEILGKQRLVYESGNWNEWYVMFDTGQEGWLGEAQGFLMMSFPSTAEKLPAVEELAPGRSIVLQGRSYEVEDVKEVVCQGGMGELPVRGEKGRKFVTVDLAGENSTFANIVYEDKPALYLGRYMEFDDFKFQNLREIDGW